MNYSLHDQDHCGMICGNMHISRTQSSSARVAGSTSTSLWTHYAAGERDYCGVAFPDGMRKNDRLARNVVTPTTKAADHDAPVSPAQIVDRGLMSQADWDTVCCARWPNT